MLLNPHAAGGRAAALARPLSDWLAEHAPGTGLRIEQALEPARAALGACAPGTRVVLIGGDGSVQHMLAPLVERGLELALVPLGSGNDCARALGLARFRGRWQAALRHALAAPARPIDLGRWRDLDTPEEARSGGWFASSLAAGFDAAIAIAARGSPRWLIGLPRYLAATLAELARLEPRMLALEWTGADGRHGRQDAAPCLFASVLNTASYGAGMPAAPGARIDDGAFELLVAGRFDRLGALAMLPLLLAGQHLRHARVRLERCTQVRIESDRPLPLAADGEPLEPARRIELALCPRALRAVHG